MQDLLLGYLLPIALLIVAWIGLIYASKRKRNRMKNRRRFGGR